MAAPAEQTPEVVIRVVDLVKRFDDRVVLDHINLDVRRGETMVIMGPSGCGKTQLLLHMIGLTWPDEGHVEVFGLNFSDAADEQVDALRKRFGVLFQSAALFNSMTVAENIALPLREHTNLDEKTIEIMVRMKLEQVSLRHAISLMPSELSGGMKKRVGLARALALDPEILFYDEPSAGLDPITSTRIDRLMSGLAKKLGITSVVVTHDMESAFHIADRMAMLHEGRILKVGRRDEFAAIRDAKPGDDPVTNTIRQFLRGEFDGPIEDQAPEASDYAADILDAAEGK